MLPVHKHTLNNNIAYESSHPLVQQISLHFTSRGVFVYNVRYLVLLRCFGIIRASIHVLKGTAVAQWLTCCATNQKVVGSIPDGVIGNFH